MGACLFALAFTIGTLTWTERSNDSGFELSSDIDTVRLLRPDFPEIYMHRLEGQWSMTEPCNVPVNEQRLEPLLQSLQSSGHQYNAAEVDLDAAGLTPSQATVYLNDNRIELGKTDIQGNRRYALKNRSVEFVPEWVLSLINGGVSAFARLEPFGETLSLLSFAGQSVLSESDLDIWRTISAQQIIEVAELDLTQTQPVISAQATLGSQQIAFEMYRQPTYIALRFADAACAYVLPPDSLPLPDKD